MILWYFATRQKILSCVATKSESVAAKSENAVVCATRLRILRLATSFVWFLQQSCIRPRAPKTLPPLLSNPIWYATTKNTAIRERRTRIPHRQPKVGVRRTAEPCLPQGMRRLPVCKREHHNRPHDVLLQEGLRVRRSSTAIDAATKFCSRNTTLFIARNRDDGYERR